MHVAPSPPVEVLFGCAIIRGGFAGQCNAAERLGGPLHRRLAGDQWSSISCQGRGVRWEDPQLVMERWSLASTTIWVNEDHLAVLCWCGQGSLCLFPSTDELALAGRDHIDEF
jgi:hypothetical protein